MYEPPPLVITAYLVAGVLFILSLGGLSKQTTAGRGNMMGMIGMALALLTAVLSEQVSLYQWLIAAMIPAAIIGAVFASRVQMTQMPQLVALLHSFVGAAARRMRVAWIVSSSPTYGVFESLSGRNSSRRGVCPLL